MNDDKLCIFPDALIAMIVTEAQDRALAQMSGPEAAGDVQLTINSRLRKRKNQYIKNGGFGL